MSFDGCHAAMENFRALSAIKSLASTRKNFATVTVPSGLGDGVIEKFMVTDLSIFCMLLIRKAYFQYSHDDLFIM